MKIIKNPLQIQKISIELMKKNKSMGLVPTMGALHLGHISLIKKSVSQNDITVVSIYVNPIQFGPNEDYKRYPRPIKDDIEICKKNGVDYLFLPTNETLYDNDFSTYVTVDKLSNMMCGVTRPIHFRGVATIVSKLFNMILPDRAYFGLKDYQQYTVIKQMVKDLNFKIKVIGCPIVREKNGLAMSSRNTYLSQEAKENASNIHKILVNAKKSFNSGKNIFSVIKEAGILLSKIENSEVDYIEARDSNTLQPVQTTSKKVVIAVAVKVQNIRLIDNILC
ncbi:MAG: pantoate--beta-alanine ligase [Endomicrobiaceae bacterium]|nr:pantoate--beta-alanine ligase [Endomicrobiaceae bacterium]MDD3922798.1 pantoate--beta-alanine ligase [Endomicrobiaceae bacterium]